MLIQNKDGVEISTMDEWEKCVSKKHWKKYHSALSLAKFFLHHDGANYIQARICDALGETVKFTRAQPEYEVRFDRYNKGRQHDIGIFGETQSSKRVFVGVEAKVNESFGKSVCAAYLSAKNKRNKGKPTDAPERIENLVANYLPTIPISECDAPYQVLYSIAGTLAKESDLHVFYVMVFKTKCYKENTGQKNLRDYEKFMSLINAKRGESLNENCYVYRLSAGGKNLICLYEFIDM